MDSLIFAGKFCTALGCGLMAGLFFAFSNSVMQALSRLPAREGIAAMQSINLVILNPLFLAIFMGTTLACLLLAILGFLRRHDPGALPLIAGCALYLVGAFLVTAACNVPLNDVLAAITPTDPQAAPQWASYLAHWMPWNHVRTVSSLAAMAMLLFSLILERRGANALTP